MVAVRVYVEGGGSTRAEQEPLRRGFQALLAKVLGDAPRPKVICAGGRANAFKEFRAALVANPDAVCLLLVDSEEPVAKGISPWQHVKERAGDGWGRPDGVTDDQLHFMVELMEAWLVADRGALRGYYGPKLNEGALPRDQNVEAIPKADLVSKLEAATRPAKPKGTYTKWHGFDLIGRIDPAKLRAAAPGGYAVRFFDKLLSVTPD